MLNTQSRKTKSLLFTYHPLRQRAVWLIVIFGVVGVLAFYNAGNSETLLHDNLLNNGDFVSAAVCHRLSSHSFSLYGRSLPLCARCSGIYLGILLTFVLLAFSGRRRWGAFPPTPILITLLAMVAVMGIDGVNSYSHFFPNIPHLYTPRNWLRVITGMGTGLAIGNIMFPALAQTVWRDMAWRHSLGSFTELGILVGIAGIIAALILSNQPSILYVLAVASVAGILLIFACINAMLFLIFFKREGRYTKWRQAMPLFGMGLMLTIIELGLISYGRLAAYGTISGLPGLS